MIPDANPSAPQVLSNYVAAAAVEATGADVVDVMNPATGDLLARFRDSTASDVDVAVQAAADALPVWAAKSSRERSDFLRRVGDAVESNLDEIARLEVIDAGKPWTASRHMELPGLVDALRLFAALAGVGVAQHAGEFHHGATSYLRREPLGVVAAITPWNYPVWQAVWKVVPALAAGNTVVVKPAENAPLSTLRFVELAGEILPPGVLNLVNGRGVTTGRALVEHPKVAAISFTGSTEAGRSIAASASAGPKRLVLELGGNAPVIVFEDADLERSAMHIAGCALFNAGQECMAATRVLVHEALHDRFVAVVKDVMESIVVMGDTLDPETNLGPLISEQQRQRVQGIIDRLPAHATVVTGGRAAPGAGFYYPPTLVTGVMQHDEIVQTEVFGPVATVQSFSGEAEAIALANGVEQGLAASVWTRDVGRATRVVNALEFGAVWVNTHMTHGPEMPVGGFGGSGYGKEGGLAGMDEFTRLKQVTVSLD